MVKKKSSKQSIIIIILCILLIISVVFGFTYSYYNGKTNLVTGKIVTASLSIELRDGDNKTDQLLISSPIEEHLVCGDNLNNIELNILNRSNSSTYIVVVYSLSAIRIDTNEDVTPKLNNTPALEFQDGAFDTDLWTNILYECKNVDKSYTCLVGKTEFEGKGSSNGISIPVLKENSVKIPGSWTNDLQNCNVTISVVAYAVQTDVNDSQFYIDLDNAKTDAEKADVIATKVLQTCSIDA